MARPQMARPQMAPTIPQPPCGGPLHFTQGRIGGIKFNIQPYRWVRFFYWRNMENLHKLIAPSFMELHNIIAEEKSTHYWLKGGRGSTKSSFISIELILGIMKHQGTNAVVLRKVGATLKESVFEQLLWAIEKLNVSAYWEKRLTPLTLIYKPTGQKILFRGADNPEKIKSLKLSKGYIRYVWFEEVSEFNGINEIRTINQSLLRGGEKFDIFYSFNPPKSVSHWVNLEAELQSLREDTVLHHSTFLTVPEIWLGEQFVAEASEVKKNKREVFLHEYLGQAVGVGAEVFANVTLRKITDDEIKSFDKVRHGLDWGYGPDPLCYVILQAEKDKILIFYEFYKYRASFDEVAKNISEHNFLNDAVTADSAEPRSNDELRSRGIRVLAAKKGAGSVEHGITWLQNLSEIVIDPERCPNVAREFKNYELDSDTNGNFKGGFPDRNNHSIDAVRYACERELKRSGTSFG